MGYWTRIRQSHHSSTASMRNKVEGSERVAGDDIKTVWREAYRIARTGKRENGGRWTFRICDDEFNKVYERVYI